MTAVVVIPGEEHGEADRRIDRLQRQLAPDGDELVLILSRHAALLSMQVERCARNEDARAAERVRTALADHDDARLARAERLFHHLGADGPTNHRRLLMLPEGVDLLIDQVVTLQVHLRGGAAWTLDHANAFDYLTGNRYHTPPSRVFALTGLIERDDASALDPAEVPAGDRGTRRAWAVAAVAGLVAAELDRLRARRAGFDPAQLAEGRAQAPDRATVSDDPASRNVRKYLFAAHRAFQQALDQIRRVRDDANRSAGPDIKAALRTHLAPREPNPAHLPPVVGSFRPNPPATAGPIDASKFTIGKPPVAPPDPPRSPRYTP